MGRSDGGVIVDEDARANIPLRALWMPALAMCATVIAAGFALRDQVRSASTTIEALKETVTAQGITIGKQAEQIAQLSIRVAELSATLKAYRGDELKR